MEFECPHCRAVLGADPGVARCARCQRFATIPDPARYERQRQEHRKVAMVIGLVVGVVYGLPLLVSIGYCAFVFVVWLVMMIAVLASA